MNWKRTRTLLPLALFSMISTSGAVTAQENTWRDFNGDIRAQKYSSLTQITPENVANLKVAWRAHTGDVSTGSGDLPQTVWSATPIYANDTLYLGTPFYRIFALEPDTGRVKWIEHLGDQNHLHVMIAETLVVTLCDRNAGLAVGDAVDIVVTAPLFFAASGERLRLQ